MADKGTIVITGIEERIKKMDSLSTKNPLMERRINEVIKTALRRVRKALEDEAAAGLQMKQDPRMAYKAVRMAVYRQIFGGQVNILQKRRHGALRLYEPPRKGTSDPKGRGGNRVKREPGGRTETMMSYTGKDRGFILRFLNQGTDDRAIHQMGGHNLRIGSVSIMATRSIGGNRGQIAGRHWFSAASTRELEQAALQIDKMIDDIILGVMY